MLDREQKWGMYNDVIEDSGYEKGTLKVIKSVCENVKPLIRINTLSFAHHQQVAPLEPEQQKEWLNKACGKWLAENARKPEEGRPKNVSNSSTLKELGVTRDESSRLQKIADNSMNIHINISSQAVWSLKG